MMKVNNIGLLTPILMINELPAVTNRKEMLCAVGGSEINKSERSIYKMIHDTHSVFFYNSK